MPDDSSQNNPRIYIGGEVHNSLIVDGNGNIIIQNANTVTLISSEQLGIFRSRITEFFQKSCSNMAVIGRPSIPLNDLYQSIPLLYEIKKEDLPFESVLEPPFLSQDLSRWEEEAFKKAVKHAKLELEDAFRSYSQISTDNSDSIPHIIVLGPPGSGKSLLIQRLSYLAIHQNAPFEHETLIPVRIKLRDWQTQKGLAFPFYLAHCFGGFADFDTTPIWQNWLLTGRILILLDGLDELNRDEMFESRLKSDLEAYKLCPVVITSRTIGFESFQDQFRDFKIFTLAGLQEDQRNRYIRNYPTLHPKIYDAEGFIRQISSSPQLYALAANPLLLSIMCFSMDDSKRLSLSIRRCDLYNKIIGRLLGNSNRITINYALEEPLPERKISILSNAAFYLFLRSGDERRLVFSEEELVQELTYASKQFGYTDASFVDSFSKDLISSGLLQGSSEEGYWFLHLTIHEFLVARALAELINNEGWEIEVEKDGIRYPIYHIIDKKTWQPAWGEVIVLLAGLLDRPLELINLLIGYSHDDILLHRHGVAARCLQELASDQFDGNNELSSRIGRRIFYLFYWKIGYLHWEIIAHLKPGLSTLASINSIVLENQNFKEWAVKHLSQCKQREYISDQGILLIGEAGRGANYPEIVDGLVSLLNHPNASLRRAVIEVLEAIGHTLKKETEKFLNEYPSKNNWPVGLDENGIENRLLGALDGKALADQLVDENYSISREARIVVDTMQHAVSTPEFLRRLAELFADPDPIKREKIQNKIPWLYPYVVKDEFLDHLSEFLENSQRDLVRDILIACSGFSHQTITNRKLFTKIFSILSNKDKDLHSQALSALRVFNPNIFQDTALERLGEFLFDSDEQIREDALWLMYEFRETSLPSKTISRLIDSLFEENPEIQDVAARLIQSLCISKANSSQIVEKLTDCVFSKNKRSGAAIYLLAELAQEDCTIPEFNQIILEVLTSPKPEDQLGAAYAIHKIGSAAITPSILDHLIDMMYSDEEMIRNATLILSEIELDPSKLSEYFWQQLEHALTVSNPEIRENAIYLVSALGKQQIITSGIIRGLIHLLNDESINIQQNAIFALGEFGKLSIEQGAIAALQNLLLHPEYSVYSLADQVLQKLDSVSIDLLSDLEMMLLNSNEGVRWHALSSLAKLGYQAAEPEIVKIVTELIECQNQHIQSAAIEVLYSFGIRGANPTTLTCLIHNLKNVTEWDYKRAIQTIKIQSDHLSKNKKTITEIIKLLEDLLESDDVLSIQTGLKLIPWLDEVHITKKMLSLIENLLRHPNEDIRLRTLNCLQLIAGRACIPTILEQVGHLLEDNYTYVHDAAVKVICAMGQNAIYPSFINNLMHRWKDTPPIFDYSALLCLTQNGIRIFRQSKDDYVAQNISVLGSL